MRDLRSTRGAPTPHRPGPRRRRCRRARLPRRGSRRAGRRPGLRSPPDPREAEVIVGPSAGSLVGALLRSGFSARDLAARLTGEALSPEGAELLDRSERAGMSARLPSRPPGRRGLPRMASPSLLVRAALRPFWMNRPGVMLAGALPAGAGPTRLGAAPPRPPFGRARPGPGPVVTR